MCRDASASRKLTLSSSAITAVPSVRATVAGMVACTYRVCKLFRADARGTPSPLRVLGRELTEPHVTSQRNHGEGRGQRPLLRALDESAATRRGDWPYGGQDPDESE